VANINIVNEDLLTFFEASKKIHRWRQRGVRGVKLETCLIGGRRFTSQQAIERFVQAMPDDDGHPAVVTTSTKRELEIRAAERELNKHGI
jgi:hypothetical protein